MAFGETVVRRRRFPTPTRTTRAGAIAVFLCGLAGVFAAESSEPAPLAATSLLLDVTAAGKSFVAVGDHGHVLISTDEGLHWTQSPTPTRAMLTGVSFSDATHGWAVGHEGVIIATSDGGATWTRQDHGDELDVVYLSVLFLDPQHGFAVGAYGRFSTTEDGGKTWTTTKPVADEVHFNRISRAGDLLCLAGERGTLLLSHDTGRTWSRENVPYEGSLYGALSIGADSLIVYGLRGHILRSDDGGQSWISLGQDAPVLIMGGARQPNGVVVLGGQAGNLFVSRDGGRSFANWQPAGFGHAVADLVPTPDGFLLTVGEAGAVRLKLP